MKKLILIGGVAVVMFAVSASLSYILKQGQHQPEKEGSSASADKDKEKDKTSKITPTQAPKKTETTPPPTTPPQAALRPPYNPAAEEILRLQTQLKDSQARVDAEEKRLTTRKKMLELIQEDIRKERGGIDGLRKELNEHLKIIDEKFSALDRKMAELDKKNLKYEQQFKANQKVLTEIDTVEQDRVKQMAAIYDSMEAEKAAQILQQMADSGNMDTAVKVLASMRERQAARVLGELQDRALAAEMFDKLKVLKKPSTAPPK